MARPHRRGRLWRTKPSVIVAIVPVIAVLNACAGSPAVSPPPVASASVAGRYLDGGDTTHPVDLLPDGAAYTWQEAGFVFRDTYVLAGDTITFTGESCDGAKGTYRWSLDGDALSLAAVDDPCVGRSSVLIRRLARAAEQRPFTVVQPSKLILQPGYNLAAADAAGDLYTTDGHRGFYKYHPDGTVVGSWPDALSFTVGITVDSRGHIYVANFDDGTVHKFDGTGNPLRQWTVDGGAVGPVGIAHDAHDNIYVALHRIHDHYVEKYSPDGKLLATWAGLGAGDGQVGAGSHDGPSEIAVDAAGNSYITDPVNNRVVSFGSDGTFRYNLTGNGDRTLVHPSTVAVDTQGNVYTDSGLTLWKFDRTGAFVGEWFTPTPGTIVVDGRDRVLQVDAEIRLLGFPAP